VFGKHGPAPGASSGKLGVGGITEQQSTPVRRMGHPLDVKYSPSNGRVIELEAPVKTITPTGVVIARLKLSAMSGCCGWNSLKVLATLTMPRGLTVWMMVRS